MGEPRTGIDPQGQGNPGGRRRYCPLPERHVQCTPSPPRSAPPTPCCRASPAARHHPPASPAARHDPPPPPRAHASSACAAAAPAAAAAATTAGELDGLLLRAALCLAESREPRRLVPGSHRCSPGPGPRSRAERGATTAAAAGAPPGGPGTGELPPASRSVG